MLISTSPIEDALSEIERDLTDAASAIGAAGLLALPAPVLAALDSGRAAARMLREVHTALADLEYGPALIVTDALERGMAAG